jgi:hypothetical protein
MCQAWIVRALPNGSFGGRNSCDIKNPHFITSNVAYKTDLNGLPMEVAESVQKIKWNKAVLKKRKNKAARAQHRVLVSRRALYTYFLP